MGSLWHLVLCYVPHAFYLVLPETWMIPLGATREAIIDHQPHIFLIYWGCCKWMRRLGAGCSSLIPIAHQCLLELILYTFCNPRLLSEQTSSKPIFIPAFNHSRLQSSSGKIAHYFPSNSLCCVYNNWKPITDGGGVGVDFLIDVLPPKMGQCACRLMKMSVRHVSKLPVKLFLYPTIFAFNTIYMGHN